MSSSKGDQSYRLLWGGCLLAQVNFLMCSLPPPSERYTEQVTPLLVYAQRQLLLRIQAFNGPDVAQQACGRYETDNREKVSRAVSQAAATHIKGKDLGAKLAVFSRGHSPSRSTNIIDNLPLLKHFPDTAKQKLRPSPQDPQVQVRADTLIRCNGNGT